MLKERLQGIRGKDEEEHRVGGARTSLPCGPAGPTPPCWTAFMVDYYGTPTPIQQIAAISSPDPRTLLITPWDASALKAH